MLWKFYIHSTPNEHPNITQIEKEYILNNSSSQVNIKLIKKY